MQTQIDCFICGKANLTHNEIALNKKIINRKVEKFHCMNCLAEYLEISTEDLIDKIQEFKDSGCLLFD